MLLLRHVGCRLSRGNSTKPIRVLPACTPESLDPHSSNGKQKISTSRGSAMFLAQYAAKYPLLSRLQYLRLLTNQTLHAMHSRQSGSITSSGRPRRRAAEACTFCRRRKVGHIFFSMDRNAGVRMHCALHPKLTCRIQIKCNNEQPTCANCKTYGKDCMYEPLTDSPSAQRATPSAPRQILGQSRRRRVEATVTPEQQASIAPTQPRLDDDDRDGNDGGDGNNSLSTPQADGIESSGNRPRNERCDPPSQPTPASAPGTHRPGVSRMLVSANGVSSYHGRTSTLFEETIQERASAAESRPRMPDEWTEKGLVAEAAKQGTGPSSS